MSRFCATCPSRPKGTANQRAGPQLTKLPLYLNSLRPLYLPPVLHQHPQGFLGAGLEQEKQRKIQGDIPHFSRFSRAAVTRRGYTRDMRMTQDEQEGIPLSEKIRNLAESAIAISPIIRRFALPGLVGFLLIGLGWWQQTTWLTIAGLILAAPILWCYVVLAFVVPLMALFHKPQPPYWKE